MNNQERQIAQLVQSIISTYPKDYNIIFHDIELSEWKGRYDIDILNFSKMKLKEQVEYQEKVLIEFEKQKIINT